MDEEFKIRQKTDFCFINAKKKSVIFVKTVDKIDAVRREHPRTFWWSTCFMTLFCKTYPCPLTMLCGCIMKGSGSVFPEL